MNRNIKTAWNNLKKRRYEIKLTVFSVTIGISSIILISSMGLSSKYMILQSINGVGMSGMLFSHSYSRLDGISFSEETVELVEESVPYVTAMPLSYNVTTVSMCEKTKKVLAIGTGEALSAYVSAEMLNGRMLEENDISDAREVAVITDSTAESVFGRTDVIGQTVFIGKEKAPYTVIGVIRSQTVQLNPVLQGIPEFMYVPYTSYEKTNAVATNSLLVKGQEGASSDTKTQVLRVIKSSLGESFSLEVTNFDEGQQGVEKIADILTSSMTVSASVSLFVAEFGILSMMLLSVSQRKQEIGIMKALGANKIQVAMIFFWESLLLSIIGILCGIGVGICTLKLLFVKIQFNMVIDWRSVLIAAISALTGGVFFGAVPALKAAKQDPIDALKR